MVGIRDGPGAAMPDRVDISFNVSPNSGVPIYRQLVDQIERLVSCDVLRADDLLPSVADVARQLSINPMTVSRAYNLLTERGALVRIRGVGMQVAPNTTRPADERLAMLRPQIEELWLQAEQLGLERSAVLDHLAQDTGVTP